MTNTSKRRRKNSPGSFNRFLYPAFLDLTGKRCVLIGGGKVAERKAISLLRAGADVVVISPTLSSGLRTVKEKGRITHIPRPYEDGDIRSAFLIIAATDSEETNSQIAADAKKLDKLLNVVDTPSLCSFIVPSVLSRGLLTIAISTGGASPALAKEIRKELQRLYGPAFSRHLKVLRDTRSKALREITNKKERERFLKEAAVKVLRSGPYDDLIRTKKRNCL